MLSSAIENNSSVYEVNGSPISKHMGFLAFGFEDFNCIVEDPLEYVCQAKDIIDRKKHTFEAICYYACAKLVLNLFGVKVAGAITRRVLFHTTLAFSNAPGPVEEISFHGHPVAYIAPSVYGHQFPALKIDELVDQTKHGTFVPHGRQDVLAVAVGKPDHCGRVLAAGKGVGLSEYFGRASCTSSTSDAKLAAMKQKLTEELTEKLTQEFQEKNKELTEKFTHLYV